MFVLKMAIGKMAIRPKIALIAFMAMAIFNSNMILIDIPKGSTNKLTQ